MSKSRSFDRASQIYDQTRPLLEPIAKYGIPAIVDIIGPQARLLEVGSGTGRISIPLLERGVNWIGCDLSSNMLRRFQEKYPSAPIAQADGTLLPFPRDQFDAVLTVHVMHLIPPWRQVLGEFRRVLVPGGVYLNMSTWAPVGNTVSGQIREFWRGWLAANGTEVGHPGVGEQAELEKELRSLGAVLSEVETERFPYSFYLDQQLDQFASRSFSETWDLPDDLFNASIKELRAWATHEYGNLDREIQDEVRCVIHVAHFSA
jgi:ubiquinone/menaquinone biosynthesis C-methylase UbiE